MSPDVLLKEATNDGTEQSIIMTYSHSPNVFGFFCKLYNSTDLHKSKVFEKLMLTKKKMYAKL